MSSVLLKDCNATDHPFKDQTEGEKIWYKDPFVLIDPNRMKYFFPNKRMTKPEKINSVMRYSIYLFIALSLIRRSTDTLYIPVGVALLTWFLGSYTLVKETYTGDVFRVPTEDNPFMNTLLTDVGKKTPEAAPTCDPEIKKGIEYLFNKGVYKDVEDIYNKNNNQRMFFTMPNTNEYGVKNGDTVRFANWLYNKPAPTCKEDTRFCADGRSFMNNYDKLMSKRQLLVPDYPICGLHRNC